MHNSFDFTTNIATKVQKKMYMCKKSLFLLPQATFFCSSFGGNCVARRRQKVVIYFELCKYFCIFSIYIKLPADQATTIRHLWDICGTSVGFRWQVLIKLQVLFGLRDLKECDGTHSERSARKVPTLRNQRKHRTNQATTVSNLWDSCVLSVAFLVSLFSFPFSEDHRPLAEGIKTGQEERENKNSPD